MHELNIRTYKERSSEGILTELTGVKGMDSPSQARPGMARTLLAQGRR